jgi:hypothetical protein
MKRTKFPIDLVFDFEITSMVDCFGKSEIEYLRQKYGEIQGVVYFLFYQGECIYIGQTENLWRRLDQHTNKIFDQVKFFYVSNERQERIQVEDHYIRTYQTPYNHEWPFGFSGGKSALWKLPKIIY